jgi:peptidoglycan/LPS O-acetylase OafA/YrhL
MSEVKRLSSLDLLRGGAAFLVLPGHLRAYLLPSYAMAGQGDLHIIIFYLLTGLGHQAVIVFFALSGFLVGGRAFSDILQHGEDTCCAGLPGYGWFPARAFIDVGAG